MNEVLIEQLIQELVAVQEWMREQKFAISAEVPMESDIKLKKFLYEQEGLTSIVEENIRKLKNIRAQVPSAQAPEEKAPAAVSNLPVNTRGYVMGPARRKLPPGKRRPLPLWCNDDGTYMCGECAGDEPVMYVEGVVTCTRCGALYDEPEDAGVLRLTREVAELRAMLQEFAEVRKAELLKAEPQAPVEGLALRELQHELDQEVLCRAGTERTLPHRFLAGCSVRYTKAAAKSLNKQGMPVAYSRLIGEVVFAELGDKNFVLVRWSQDSEPVPVHFARLELVEHV